MLEDSAVDAGAVAFDVVATGIGLVLVACTPRGVCRVAVGEDEAALESRLRAEFPRAGVIRDPDAVGPWAEDVVRCAGGEGAAGVPLEMRGTPFQVRVWRALLEIPLGETRSYSEVASAIGHPRAVRAVAGACAANPVGLLVPCHRVIRADGTLGGYGWGLERKRALLDAEAARARSHTCAHSQSAHASANQRCSTPGMRSAMSPG